MICATTIGFTSLDSSVCAQSIFNSTALVLFPITDLISHILSGSGSGSMTCVVFIGVPCPTVEMNRDMNDGPGGSPSFPPLPFFQTLGAVFTDQQEALIGCGVYWGTNCDTSTTTTFGGLDLLNMEASFLAQAFVGVEGTDDQALLAAAGAPRDPGPDGIPGTSDDGSLFLWVTNLATLPQPGTVAYRRPPDAYRSAAHLRST